MNIFRGKQSLNTMPEHGFTNLIITLVGLWLTYSLFHHPTPAKKKGMKLYLIFINAWVAVVYYHIYCDPRSYSNALAWGIMCVFWIYDLIVDYTL